MTNQVVPSNTRFSPKRVTKAASLGRISPRKEIAKPHAPCKTTSPVGTSYFFRLSTIAKDKPSCTRQLFYLSEARSLKLADEIDTMTDELDVIQQKSEQLGFDFHAGEPIPDHERYQWKLVTPEASGFQAPASSNAEAEKSSSS